MSMAFAGLVVVLVVAHYAFLAYLLIGGYLARRRPWTIWLHVAVAAWGIAILLGVVECPLTIGERWARDAAGMAPLDGSGFIAHYVAGVLYPPGYGTAVDVVVFGVVVVSWALFSRQWLRTREAAGP